MSEHINCCYASAATMMHTPEVVRCYIRYCICHGVTSSAGTLSAIDGSILYCQQRCRFIMRSAQRQTNGRVEFKYILCQEQCQHHWQQA